VTSGTSSLLYRTAFVGQTGWAVGQAGVVLHTSDGGLGWSPQTSGVSEDLFAVSFSDAIHGWAVGAGATILRTSDGGTSWIAQTAPNPDRSLQGVVALSETDGVIVGYAGELARTTNQGADWVDARETIRAGHSNVVATRSGTTLPDEEVLLVGHYDSTSNEPEPEILAPGADDNGSGIAVIVESARIMAEISFERTIRFVCFSEEELGFIGSDAYVSRALSQGENIVAAFNLDSVGWNDDYFRIFSRTHSAWFGDIAAEMAATHVPWLPTYHWDCPSCGWSDQISFWNAGLDAIVGIETWDPAPPQHHTAGDTLGLMDMNLVAGVTKIAASTIATVAAVDTTGGVAVGDGLRQTDSGAGIRFDPPQPNPTHGSSELRFALSRPGRTQVRVVDAGGRRVCTLHDGWLDEGVHRLVWNGRTSDGLDAVAGVYFVEIQSRGLTAGRRVVRLK
jgi:hypothetical protein